MLFSLSLCCVGGKQSKISSFGRRFQDEDELVDSESDSDKRLSNREKGDGWLTARNKKGDNDATRKRLRRNGMAIDTPSNSKHPMHSLSNHSVSALFTYLTISYVYRNTKVHTKEEKKQVIIRPEHH